MPQFDFGKFVTDYTSPPWAPENQPKPVLIGRPIVETFAAAVTQKLGYGAGGAQLGGATITGVAGDIAAGVKQAQQQQAGGGGMQLPMWTSDP